MPVWENKLIGRTAVGLSNAKRNMSMMMKLQRSVVSIPLTRQHLQPL